MGFINRRKEMNRLNRPLAAAGSFAAVWNRRRDSLYLAAEFSASAA